MTLVPVTGTICFACGAHQRKSQAPPGRCCGTPLQLRILLNVPPGDPVIETDAFAPAKNDMPTLDPQQGAIA